MERLLAKSRNVRGEELTLLQHLSDTEQAVRLVFAEESRCQKAWLRFFGVPIERHASFWKMLRVAALFHDIGKANEDFQSAVTRTTARPQSVRHEHLSALVLCMPACREWLAAAGVDPDMVTAAVLSHHIKAASSDNHQYSWCQSHGRASVALYLAHSDVQNAFQRVANIIGSGAPPALPAEPWHSGPPWSDVYDQGHRRGVTFGRSLTRPERQEDRRLLAALKAGLIAADAVASGIAREGKTMPEWVAHNAHGLAIAPEEIDRAIIVPRAQEVQRRTGKPFELHSFQELTGQEGPRTLLIAPCGAGKTLAAWEWAKRQAVQRQFGRVIFLYPTRGTATEGFRDYVGWAPEGDSTLLHGSSAFELAAMAANPPESLADKDISKSEAEARMFALGLWRFRFFSATVDQFLSFMQNRYQSLCLLPALADSALVLDEVHSYDPSMFEMLLRFLREFDVPVLCMTATLPQRRIEQLVNAGLTVFPRKEHQSKLSDLTDTADHPRYRIQFEPSADAAIAEAIIGYRKGNRVLVVVNRVARCLEVARAIETALGSPPLVYHSRFRLMDRQDRHRAVVDAFKGNEPAIAVTTQVCEMSLDLDAQILVTEVAPVPSLIQRLGRANRHLKDRSRLADVIVYPPQKSAPYDRGELEVATKFVKSVIGDTSQATLAQALETGAFSPSEAFLDDAGHFLSGGYFALPGSFRDEDQNSVQCVCDGDLNAVEALYAKGDPIDGFLLPAPKTKRIADAKPRLPRHVGIVSSTNYSPLFGLQI